MPFSASLQNTCRLLLRYAAPSRSGLFKSIKSRPCTVLIICLCWMFSTFTSVSAAPAVLNSSRDFLDLPSEYGKVIYRINAQSPKQLYIIGINHKDPESGANNNTTVQTQMEIFRIGEWLKKNTNLNLLLPEGYFSSKKAVAANKPSGFQALDTYNPVSNPVHLDNLLIQEKLTAVTPYVNAEMLLMKYHSFLASQVEDKGIYDAVRNSLCKLSTAGRQSSAFAGDLAELLYLQKVRTAQILQNIPDVIENEFLSGAIENRNALFTIGLNHIKYIFRYIQDDGIKLTSPIGSAGLPDFICSSLNILNKGYGVTIIIPRTLANDSKLLQMTSIDRILVADDKYSQH